MKVEHLSNPLSVYRLKPNSKTDAPVTELTAGIRRFADTLEISHLASAKPLAEAAAKELETNSSSRIDELQQAISNGTYFVSSRDLAEALKAALL